MAEESGIDRTAAARMADCRRRSSCVGIRSMVDLPLATRPVSGDRHGGLREGRGGVRPLMAQHPDPEARGGTWRQDGGPPGDDAGLARWRGQNRRAPYGRGAYEPRGGGGRGRGRGWREDAKVREGRPQRPEGRAELDLVRGRAGSQPRRGGSRVQRGESNGRGRRNSSSVPRELRAELEEEHAMGFKALEAFLEAEPGEIALRLSTPRSGLRPLLKLEVIRKDLLELLIRVVGRASTSKTNRQSHFCLVGLVKDSKFLKLVLPIFITSMPEESSPARTALYPVLVSSMLDIASALLAVFPNSSIAEASLLLTLLNATVTALCHGGDHSLEDAEGRLRDLQRQVQARQERRREGLADTHGPDLHPPENFRELPLYPSYADIRPDRKPFVRPNIVCGRYPDAATYLDVQFRLLREDFMRPLREGIAEVLGATAVGGANALNGRFNDVRVYPGASVVAPICTPQGLVHTVRFDVAALRNVHWENSKRLLFGSLVCLSSDGFATMLFATVAERSIEDLRRGFVCLAFAPESRGLLRAIGPRECFLMAESTSYFEAFRYVLEGLKEVDENELPFGRYLVDCEKVVEPPRYLRDPLLAQSPSYDFSCLLLDHHATAQAQVVAPALRPKRWPTKEEMGLDESQMEALVVAVTQELSIIQGPPGTGKTYMGLKISELLLNNTAAWNQVDPGPILVVCYTNHALDQFLEGITKMVSTDGVVRVGGRCSRDSLESCTLKKLRVKHRDNKQTYLRRLFYEVKTEMAQCQEMLEQETAQLMAAHLGILRDSALMSHVDREHWEQLEQVVKQCMKQMVMGSKRVSCIMEWLGLGFSELAAQQLPGVHGGAQPGQEEELEEVLEELEKELEEEFVGNRMIEEDRAQHDNIAERRRAMIELHREFVAFSVEDRGAGEEGEGEEEKEEGRWQSAMSKRNMKRMVTSELKKAAFTSDDEERQIQNVWHLTMAERWRLYRLWVTRYQTSIRDTIAAEEDRYQRLADQLSEVRDEEDYGILKKATVIGMTTTGAAKFRGLLQKVRPKIVIVEEAAEVLEAHIITTLSSACKHLILIGDHQQLRPSASVYELAKRYKLDVSLFERLVKNSVPFARLGIQHRMRPEIAKLLVPHIYDRLENHASVLKYENVKGVATNLYFVQHSHAEVEVKDTKSRQNLHEADFVVALCRHLLLQGYAPERITVLTTYTGQLLALRKRMPRDRYGGVRVCVVDKYQGEENDLVLLSLVRSNAQGRTGFLNIDNRVCVALSRARIGFFIVGDAKMLSAVPLWKRVIGELHAGGRIGPALTLRCQNHPEREAAVVTAKDFARAPEGGCELLCEFRLDCGHVCTRCCHTEDPEHNKFKCQKPCGRTICELGHRCRKVCNKRCGKCTEPVAKTMAACGHKQMVPCHMDTADFSCLVPCPKPQACGHACPRPCGKDCPASCLVLVRERQACGHEREVPCSRRHEPVPCHEHCQTALACGHACRGNCRRCLNGRWHAACREACERSLPCSHQCTEPCAARGCPPCAQRCRNRCVHSACARPCGQPCVPCAEPCEWRCEHHICQRLCHEECDRPRCDKPCRRRLPCGHACVGYCGEPCPSKCRICHAAEVAEIFFGNEDEPSARFVELEDCKHLVEGTGLDRWMESSDDGGGAGDGGETPVAVKLKECPKCKTPIRRNLRYGKIIKRTLRDIEAVKRKLWGSDEEIAQAKNRVQEILAKVNPKPLPASPLHALLNLRHLLLGDKTMVSEWRIPTGYLSALLEGERNLLQINAVENKATLLADIAKLRPELSKISMERKEVVKEALDELVEWMCERQTAGLTEQQLQDLRTETLRLSFLIKVQAGMSVASSVVKVSDAATAISEEIMKILTNKRRFGPEQEKEVRRLAESLKEELPKSGLGISDSERASIVKAIGLKPGHWYKCPRGHVYAIGECGGAMQKGTCPECGEQIGGEHHRLQAGNAVATEMDGARHGAWSDTGNNMFNYDELHDFL